MPTRLGRYRILSRLGRGEMGTVYRAEDPVIGRPLAIKVLRPLPDGGSDALSDRRARFEREMRIAGSFSHPSIVMLHDVGNSDEGTFIVMEHIDGGSLADLMAEQASLPFEQVAELVEQIAAALDYAHEHGVYHRDVKPANILLTADGRPKVADFGVARLAGYTMTRQGTTYGSPAYMSPEQASGHKVDGKSDQFSMAIIAYQMITGQLPFSGDTLTAVIYQILNNNPVPPELVNPRVPPAATETILKGLSKNPELRYPDCRSFARSLSGALRSGWNESYEQMPASEPATLQEGTVAMDPAPEATIAEPPPEPSPGGADAAAAAQGSGTLAPGVQSGPNVAGAVGHGAGTSGPAPATAAAAAGAAAPGVSRAAGEAEPFTGSSTLERMHAGLQSWDPTEPREAMTVFVIAFLMVLTATLSLHVGAAPSPRRAGTVEDATAQSRVSDSEPAAPEGPVFPMPVPSDATGLPFFTADGSGPGPAADARSGASADVSGAAGPGGTRSGAAGSDPAGPGERPDRDDTRSASSGAASGDPSSGGGPAGRGDDGISAGGSVENGGSHSGSPDAIAGDGATASHDHATAAGVPVESLDFEASAATFEGWYPGASLDDKLAERAFDSARLLRTTLEHPEANIPDEIVDAARCVAVIPGVVKVGFLFGGRYGKGLVSCRAGGGWSAPSFVSVKGGSFGLQAGVQSTDFVLVLVGADSPDWMSAGSLKLGGDASVTAGPLARNAEASTALGGNTEVFSYAYTEGLFAGVSLEGATLKADRDAIEDVYGPEAGPGDILRRRGGLLPQELVEFVWLLDSTSR